MENPLKSNKLTPVTNVFYIPTHLIATNPNQPRKFFSEEGLKKLADSIASEGQIQAGIVMETGDSEKPYEVVAGERRLRACKIVGCDFLAMVRKFSSEEAKYIASIVENFNRRDHTVHEAIVIVENLLKFNYTIEQIASVIGQSTFWVQQRRLIILNLSEKIIEMMKEEQSDETQLRMAAAVLIADQKDLSLEQKESLAQKLRGHDQKDFPKILELFLKGLKNIVEPRYVGVNRKLLTDGPRAEERDRFMRVFGEKDLKQELKIMILVPIESMKNLLQLCVEKHTETIQSDSFLSKFTWSFEITTNYMSALSAIRADSRFASIVIDDKTKNVSDVMSRLSDLLPIIVITSEITKVKYREFLRKKCKAIIQFEEKEDFLDICYAIAACFHLSSIQQDISTRSGIASFGPWGIDRGARGVWFHNFEITVFSPTEYSIMEILIQAKGRALSRQEIMEGIEDYCYKDAKSNVVDVHISNIREKLRNAQIYGKLKSLRGIGYRLSD